MPTKKLSAPKTFPVERKAGNTFILSASPGPYPSDGSVPLGLVLRDILEMADTLREARKALTAGKVRVNGRERKDPGFPIGPFDVVDIAGESYRAVPSLEEFLFIQIPASEAGVKLSRVEDKTVIDGGEIQLNMNDGTNIVAGDGYETGDTLLVSVPDLEIEDRIPREEGNLCMITGGRHAGEVAEIISLNILPGSSDNTVTVEADGREIEIPEEMVFVVGTNEPEIEIGDTDG